MSTSYQRPGPPSPKPKVTQTWLTAESASSDFDLTSIVQDLAASSRAMHSVSKSGLLATQRAGGNRVFRPIEKTGEAPKMSRMDKDYIDVKVEAAEARMGQRAAEGDSEIAALRGQMATFQAHLETSLTKIDAKIDHATNRLPSTGTLIVTVFTAAVSVLGLTYAFMQNSADRFESGLNAGPALDSRIEQVEKRLGNRIDAGLERIRVEIQPPSTTDPASQEN